MFFDAAFRPSARLRYASRSEIGGFNAVRWPKCRLLRLPEILQAALIESGIETVEPHILDAHKSEEQQRYPAGWFYRHRLAVQIASIAVLGVATVAASALFVLVHVALGAWLLLLTIAFAIAQSTITVRGPALWRERTIYNLNTVHPAVRASAERLRERVPQVSFRVGELIQDRATLDPYLVAEYGNEQAILGIWDGDTLIAPR